MNESAERYYRQPASPVQSWEWAALLLAIIGTPLLVLMMFCGGDASSLLEVLSFTAMIGGPLTALFLFMLFTGLTSASVPSNMKRIVLIALAVFALAILAGGEQLRLGDEVNRQTPAAWTPDDE